MESGNDMEVKKSRGNAIILTVLGIATLLVAIVGASFSFFTATLTGASNTSSITVQTAAINITYNQGASVNLTGVMPSATWTGTKTVTIQNTSAYDANYSLAWVTAANNFTTKADLQYQVICTGTGSSNLGATTMPSAPAPIMGPISVPAGVTHSCAFTFRFNSSLSNQDVDQGKVFLGSFNITANQI